MTRNNLDDDGWEALGRLLRDTDLYDRMLSKMNPEIQAAIMHSAKLAERSFVRVTAMLSEAAEGDGVRYVNDDAVVILCLSMLQATTASLSSGSPIENLSPPVLMRAMQVMTVVMDAYSNEFFARAKRGSARAQA